MTGSEDGRVSKFDLSTSSFDSVLVRCSLPIRNLALSPNTEWLAVASEYVERSPGEVGERANADTVSWSSRSSTQPTWIVCCICVSKTSRSSMCRSIPPARIWPRHAQTVSCTSMPWTLSSLTWSKRWTVLSLPPRLKMRPALRPCGIQMDAPSPRQQRQEVICTTLACETPTDFTLNRCPNHVSQGLENAAVVQRRPLQRYHSNVLVT